jgi:hypothetical protein
MLKLFVSLPILIFAMLACALGGALVVPLVLGFGAAIFSIVLAIAILACMLRLAAALVLGIGGLIVGMLGFFLVAAGFALLFAFGLALSHLLVPLLVICALVWLIRRSARPAPTAVGHF